ncbi:hypothetical protein HDV02_006524 [Globomyces sp. JEL0801]|nr:hypothetical protein HDV02_006524 [Globomyces sp. JEL0801]
MKFNWINVLLLTSATFAYAIEADSKHVSKYSSNHHSLKQNDLQQFDDDEEEEGHELMSAEDDEDDDESASLSTQGDEDDDESFSLSAEGDDDVEIPLESKETKENEYYNDDDVEEEYDADNEDKEFEDSELYGDDATEKDDQDESEYIDHADLDEDDDSTYIDDATDEDESAYIEDAGEEGGDGQVLDYDGDFDEDDDETVLSSKKQSSEITVEEFKQGPAESVNKPSPEFLNLMKSAFVEVVEDLVEKKGQSAPLNGTDTKKDGSLALHVIAFLQSKQMIHLTESNVSMVVIITFLVAGAIGGGIALCLTSLACYILGASIGYVVGAFVLNLPVAASLENTGRLGVLFAFILVGLLGGKVIEKWIFVIGSALIGSYAFCVGLDHYVKSGIFIILRNSIVDKKPPTISGIGVGMLALFVVLPVIGAAFQFNQIQKRKLQGVGYSNLKG